MIGENFEGSPFHQMPEERNGFLYGEKLSIESRIFLLNSRELPGEKPQWFPSGSLGQHSAHGDVRSVRRQR